MRIKKTTDVKSESGLLFQTVMRWGLWETWCTLHWHWGKCNQQSKSFFKRWTVKAVVFIILQCSVDKMERLVDPEGSGLCWSFRAFANVSSQGVSGYPPKLANVSGAVSSQGSHTTHPPDPLYAAHHPTRRAADPNSWAEIEPSHWLRRASRALIGCRYLLHSPFR